MTNIGGNGSCTDRERRQRTRRGVLFYKFFRVLFCLSVAFAADGTLAHAQLQIPNPHDSKLRCILDASLSRGTLQQKKGRRAWSNTSSKPVLQAIKAKLSVLKKKKRFAAASSRERAKSERELNRLKLSRTWIKSCLDGSLGEESSTPIPEPELQPSVSPSSTPTPTPVPTETTECNDGIDNDGDSWLDARDSDCLHAELETRIARSDCEDGIDNDGDGRIDSSDDGCDSDLDGSEQGISGECSDGIDNDADDLVDFPFDPGCPDAAGLENEVVPPADVGLVFGNGVWSDGQQTHTQPGVIHAITWRSPDDPTVEREVVGYQAGSDPEVLVQNPLRYFLHSSIQAFPQESTTSGWVYGSAAAQLSTEVLHPEIEYSNLEDVSGLGIRATDHESLDIKSFLASGGNQIVITSQVKSLLPEAAYFRVPINLPPILFSNPNNAVRLRGVAAGEILENFPEGTAWEYPSVESFAPVTAIWSAGEFTLGVQTLTKLRQPDGIVFEDNHQMISSKFKLFLQPGQTKTLTLIVTISAASDWQTALTPYRKWFQHHNGAVPSYCPSGAMVTASGANTSQYNSAIKRFLPDTKMSDLFPPERTEFMDGWYQFAGFWETAIDSIWASPFRHVQKESWIHLLDPNIGYGSDLSLGGFLDRFHSRNVETLWFARPSFGLSGYQTSKNSDGSDTFTPGSVLDLDYTYARDRDIYISYMDTFASAGVTGFYLDAFNAPGGESFANYVRTEFERRYGRKITVIIEGARDTFSNIGPQIPIISNWHLDGADRFGKLVPWLTPNATFYGGRVNSVLGANQISALMEHAQFQPVALDGLPIMVSKEFCEWGNAAYQNRLALFQSYGQALSKDAAPYCDGPTAPPISASDCADLPSWTGW